MSSLELEEITLGKTPCIVAERDGAMGSSWTLFNWKDAESQLTHSEIYYNRFGFID